MPESNPYTAPTSELVNPSGEIGDATVFSFQSRVGRLRYLARVGLSTLAGYLLLAVSGGILIAAGSDATSGFIIGYIVFVVVSVVFGLMFAVQRLHDLNHSGWLAILLIVPLVNLVIGLYMLFARGTAGPNNYGPPPPPNTLGVTLAGLVLPVIFIGLGIVAAISIPAYQDYVARAQQAQMQNDLK